jgi:molybdate transport system permease protein
MLTPLWLTLKVAMWATILASFAGIGVAWWMARRPFRGREVVDALLLLPMVLPPTVLGYYLLVLVGRRGLLGPPLESIFGINLIFTWQGAVLAAAVVSFPLIYKAARAAFEDIEPHVAEAARTLGATEWQLLWRVLLPLTLRGTGAGVMLGFARAMGEFGATLMVAGNLPGKTQTLSIAIYEAVQAGQDNRALWLTGLVSAVCVVLLIVAGRLLSPRS